MQKTQRTELMLNTFIRTNVNYITEINYNSDVRKKVLSFHLNSTCRYSLLDKHSKA